MNDFIDRMLEFGAWQYRAVGKKERGIARKVAKEQYEEHISDLRAAKHGPFDSSTVSGAKRNLELAYITAIYEAAGIEGLNEVLNRLRKPS